MRNQESSKGMAAVLALILLCLFFYFATGFFVIQPTGALPEGATVWYLRLGTNLPFISSKDGLLLENREGVSFLGTAVPLGELSEHILRRKIVSLPYIRRLYLFSTGGQESGR